MLKEMSLLFFERHCWLTERINFEFRSGRLNMMSKIFKT